MGKRASKYKKKPQIALMDASPEDDISSDEVIKVLAGCDPKTFRSVWPTMTLSMCSTTTVTLNDVAKLTTYVRKRYEEEPV